MTTPPEYLGSPRRHLSICESTQTVASQWAREGAPHGAIVVADEQSSGRGRQGRHWHSPSGSGLYASMILRPSIPLAKLTLLPLVAGLALARAIAVDAVRLKWPNDLVIEQASGFRKLGGILSEASIAGDEVAFAILGFGINLRVIPEISSEIEAIRISCEEIGARIDRDALIDACCTHLAAQLSALDHGADPLPAYRSRCITIGRRVRTAGVEGIARAVRGDGALEVRTASGDIVCVSAGDVDLPDDRHGIGNPV